MALFYCFRELLLRGLGRLDSLDQHGSEMCIRDRQLTRADYEKYDLLIGMDSANLRNMHRICGGDFAGKLRLLMDYTDHPRDVADPWYTEDFESTWQDELAGCQGLLREITGHHHTRE